MIAVVMVLALMSKSTYGQSIVITEISYEEWFFYDNDAEWGNGWVEIKNLSGVDVSTGSLQLKLNSKPPWALPDLILAPGDYLFIWLSGKNRNQTRDNLHASFSITEDYNTLAITDATTGQSLDVVVISSRPYWNETRSRYPEDSNSWFNSTQATPSFANAPFGPWRRVSTFSQFSPRDSSPNASLYFNNKFWILEGWEGGGGESSARSNVWKSDDGSEWELINDSPPYHPYSAYVVFKGAMWAFDGSAFSSADGVTWTKVGNDLPFTIHARVVEFKDALWAVKGTSIYRSVDGINWTTLTINAPWDNREFPAVLPFKNKLWLFGGGINYFTGQDYYFNDVWASDDGISWEKVVYETEWAGRLWFGYAAFDNRMWVMGGWNYYDLDDEYYGNKNDVWYTEDGISWFEMESANTWLPRHAPLTWASPDGLYLAAGYLNNFGLFNDVWMLQPLTSPNVNKFFLKKNANPSLLTSWGTNENGSGLRPTGFRFDSQHFTLTNNDSVAIANDWYVTGKTARIIFGNGRDSIHVQQKPGADISGNVELQANATLHLINNYSSPSIVTADVNSAVFIRGKNKLKLNSRELGHLTITGREVELMQPAIIRGSLTLENGAVVRSHDHSFHFTPASTLIYRGPDDYNGTSIEWPVTDPPGNVIIDCACTVRHKTDVVSDTVILKSGNLSIENGVLGTKAIIQANDTCYVRTETGGFVKMPVNADGTLFPIGIDNSYNPILIRTAQADKNSHVTTRAVKLDTLRDQDHAVNVGWHLSDDLEMHAPIGYEVTAFWNVNNEGSSISAASLYIKKYVGGRWLNEGRLLDWDTGSNLRFLTGKVDGPGFFSIQDSKHDQHQFVHVFPNPVVDRLTISLTEQPSGNVKLNLIDPAGNIVMKSDVSINNSKYSIPIRPSLAPGIYFLRITVDGVNYISKILKQTN